MVGPDQRVQRLVQPFLVQHRVRQVEIEPALRLPDRAAGDAPRHDGGEQVQAGMHPHMPVASLPVDLGPDLRPDGGRRGALREGVQHRVSLALRRRQHGEDRAAFVHQPAGIARLAAAGRVEHGAVERDAVGPRGRHHGIAGPRIGVVAEDEFHGPSLRSGRFRAGL